MSHTNKACLATVLVLLVIALNQRHQAAAYRGEVDPRGKGREFIEVKEGEFPFLAYLIVRQVDRPCSGAIIDAHHILTSAHCVRSSRPPCIKVGCRHPWEKGCKAIKTDLIMVHEKFMFPGLFDIALIRTLEPLPINNKTGKGAVRPIRLPHVGMDPADMPRKLVGFAKYCNTSLWDPAKKPIAKKTYVDEDNDQCGAVRDFITYSHINTCVNDKYSNYGYVGSGGSLLQRVEGEPDYVLAGIVSGQVKGCTFRRASTAVITKVFSFNHWIEKKIRSFRPHKSVNRFAASRKMTASNIETELRKEDAEWAKCYQGLYD